MARTVLLAEDVFEERHVDRIAGAIVGGAELRSIGHPVQGETYAAELAQAEVAIGWPPPMLLVESSVRFCQLLSMGYERYLGVGLEERPGLAVCTVGGALAVPVAEHAIALMVALARRLDGHVAAMGDRRWGPPLEYRELTGATACVVGLGHIGTEIARRCLGLGLTVSGVRRQSTARHELVSQVLGPGDLRRALAGADHVFLAVPGDPTGAPLLNRSALDAMRPGACLYNVGRGSLIDEQALVERITAGRIGGAGLDVLATEPLPPDSPLWHLDNVIVTPHVAGRSRDVADRLCEAVVENLDNYLAGRPLLNRVF